MSRWNTFNVPPFADMKLERKTCEELDQIPIWIVKYEIRKYTDYNTREETEQLHLVVHTIETNQDYIVRTTASNLINFWKTTSIETIQKLIDEREETAFLITRLAGNKKVVHLK